MATKPTKPDWIPDDTSDIVVPSGSKQSLGWVKAERPPYEFMNWFFNIVSQFIDYFSSQAEFNITIDSDTDEGDYTTLAAYIADSPAAGDRVLLKVDEEITGATMVIPANILLKQQKGKKLWCDENLATILQFSDGVVTEGDLLLELSHTGTVGNAISLNGDDNNHINIIVKNTTTGTITSAFEIESGKESNLARGEVLNPSGTVTNILTDSSGVTSNDVVVRLDGGLLYGADETTIHRLGRTATKNQGDSPAPDKYGGGTIWVEFRTDRTAEVVLDTSIDWRDRYIAVIGYGNYGSTALPPNAGDSGLDAYFHPEAGSADAVLQALCGGFAYTEQGGDGSADPAMRIHVENEAQTGYLYAKSADGNLAFKHRIDPVIDSDIILKIDYSPVQNHY